MTELRISQRLYSKLIILNCIDSFWISVSKHLICKLKFSNFKRKTQN